jgi:hypothetical protein
MGLIFAVVTGVLFGFFLERAGFGSPKKLTAIFYFKDFAVLRVMFTAVVVGVLGILALEEAGWVEPARVAVPTTYFWPQALGGLLIGIGFATGGY